MKCNGNGRTPRRTCCKKTAKHPPATRGPSLEIRDGLEVAWEKVEEQAGAWELLYSTLTPGEKKT
eukprot:scaffold118892_cov32-Tisochrysis_lutea.AAC.5